MQIKESRVTTEGTLHTTEQLHTDMHTLRPKNNGTDKINAALAIYIGGTCMFYIDYTIGWLMISLDHCSEGWSY